MMFKHIQLISEQKVNFARASFSRAKNLRGFTLVEMIVAIGLFTMVLFIASSAFLSVINADRKSRATRISMDNLNLSLENISRRIKTGTTYNCGGGNGVQDCSLPGNSLAFTEQDGITRTTYSLQTDINGKKFIEQNRDGSSMVNIVGESFDSSTFPPTTSCDGGSFTTGGDANWQRDTGTFNTGPASAASGAIGDYGTTWIDCNVTLSAPATLSFSWKVSSENTYDFLLFCYDNDSCTRTSGYDQRISGEVGFTTVTKAMTAGAHSLRWVYAKDNSATGGSDTGWVDDINVQKAAVANVLADSSGQGNNGVLKGQSSPTTVPGRIGQALYFNGVNDNIQIAHNSIYDATNLTIAAWVKPNALRTDCCLLDIVTKAENDDSNGYFLSLQEDNGRADAKKFTFYLAAGGVGDQLVSTTQASLGEWYHVVAVVEGTSAKLYINGVQEAANSTMPRTSTTHDLEIGSEDNGGTCCVFDGTIDDVRIYNRALSAEEVGNLYNLMNPAPENGLVGYWTFDEPKKTEPLRVTAPEVDINKLQFIVGGTNVGPSVGGTDTTQPYVIILIDGTTNANDVNSSFKIQTMVTQRAYDI